MRFAVVVLLLVLSWPVYAHPGGVDGEGCHINHQTYAKVRHCHVVERELEGVALPRDGEDGEDSVVVIGVGLVVAVVWMVGLVDSYAENEAREVEGMTFRTQVLVMGVVALGIVVVVELVLLAFTPGCL